ncbi:MAG: hypothetical protein Q7T20_14590 [Saprospiraceae bacterium]|nr:hypothetical protein [Saprospiraceae bacterium]
MKIRILLLSLFFAGLFPGVCLGQDTLNNDTYQVWLRSQQQRKLSLGYLQSLSDTTLALGTSRHNAKTGLRVFSVEQVQWIKFRERQSIVRGIGRGALFGFAVGFLYGFMQGDNSACEDNRNCIRFSPVQSGLIYSMITTPFGAVAGGAIGSFKTKITIGHSRSEYARQREVLEKYRLRQ